MLASAGLHYGFVAVHYFHLLAFYSAPSSLVLIVPFGDGARVSYLRLCAGSAQSPFLAPVRFAVNISSNFALVYSVHDVATVYGSAFFEFHDLEGLRPRRTQWVLDVSDSGCMANEEEENPRKAVSEGTFTEADEASNSAS